MRHSAQALGDIKYHVIWITKFRILRCCAEGSGKYDHTRTGVAGSYPHVAVDATPSWQRNWCTSSKAGCLENRKMNSPSFENAPPHSPRSMLVSTSAVPQYRSALADGKTANPPQHSTVFRCVDTLTIAAFTCPGWVEPYLFQSEKDSTAFSRRADGVNSPPTRGRSSAAEVELNRNCSSKCLR